MSSRRTSVAGVRRSSVKAYQLMVKMQEAKKANAKLEEPKEEDLRPDTILGLLKRIAPSKRDRWAAWMDALAEEQIETMENLKSRSPIDISILWVSPMLRHPLRNTLLAMERAGALEAGHEEASKHYSLQGNTASVLLRVIDDAAVNGVPESKMSIVEVETYVESMTRQKSNFKLDGAVTFIRGVVGTLPSRFGDLAEAVLSFFSICDAHVQQTMLKKQGAELKTQSAETLKDFISLLAVLDMTEERKTSYMEHCVKLISLLDSNTALLNHFTKTALLQPEVKAAFIQEYFSSGDMDFNRNFKKLIHFDTSTRHRFLGTNRRPHHPSQHQWLPISPSLTTVALLEQLQPRAQLSSLLDRMYFHPGTRLLVMGKLSHFIADADTGDFHHNKPIFWVKGGMGCGKSALMKNIRGLHSEVKATHVCLHTDISTGNAIFFTHSIAAQLMRSIPAYKELLSSFSVRHLHAILEEKNGLVAFDELVAVPLKKLGNKGAVLILIDAVDEANHYGKNEIYELLFGQHGNALLPSWVRFVVTSSYDSVAFDEANPKYTINLDEESMNAKDMETYLRQTLEGKVKDADKLVDAYAYAGVGKETGIEGEPMTNLEAAVDSLVEKSEGNFLCASMLCQRLQGLDCPVSVEELQYLPDGMNDWYMKIFEHAFATPFEQQEDKKPRKSGFGGFSKKKKEEGGPWNEALPLLEMIAASEEALPLQVAFEHLIYFRMGDERWHEDADEQELEVWHDVVDSVGGVFPVTLENQTPRFFVPYSAVQWMRDKKLASKFRVKPIKGHQHLAGVTFRHFKRLRGSKGDMQSQKHTLSEYTASHAIRHQICLIQSSSLSKAEREASLQRARDMLSDISVLKQLGNFRVIELWAEQGVGGSEQMEATMLVQLRKWVIALGEDHFEAMQRRLLVAELLADAGRFDGAIHLLEMTIMKAKDLLPKKGHSPGVSQFDFKNKGGEQLARLFALLAKTIKSRASHGKTYNASQLIIDDQRVIQLCERAVGIWSALDTIEHCDRESGRLLAFVEESEEHHGYEIAIAECQILASYCEGDAAMIGKRTGQHTQAKTEAMIWRAQERAEEAVVIFRKLEHPHLPRALKQVADEYRRLYMLDPSYKSEGESRLNKMKASSQVKQVGQQHSKLGRKCIGSYEEAIATFEKLGTHHFDDDYVACLQSIAGVCEDRKEWLAAVHWWEKLVDTRAMVRGEKHADTRAASTALAKAKTKASKAPKHMLLATTMEDTHTE